MEVLDYRSTASVWHWPQEVVQTVASGFDHDQTLQSRSMGSGATAHRGGQGMRYPMRAAAVWMHGCAGEERETQVACLRLALAARGRASVWHWPREVAQTVAAGFDHDQTLQGGHVGLRATAHRGGQGMRCHMNAASV